MTSIGKWVYWYDPETTLQLSLWRSS